MLIQATAGQLLGLKLWSCVEVSLGSVDDALFALLLSRPKACSSRLQLGSCLILSYDLVLRCHWGAWLTPSSPCCSADQRHAQPGYSLALAWW